MVSLRYDEEHDRHVRMKGRREDVGFPSIGAEKISI